MTNERVVMAIETSCDETAAALVMGGYDVVSSVVSTQVELHAEFGGVVLVEWGDVVDGAFGDHLTVSLDQDFDEPDPDGDPNPHDDDSDVLSLDGRRLINMFGDVVAGIDHHVFEAAFNQIKKKYKVTDDTEVPAEGLKELCQAYKEVYKEYTGAIISLALAILVSFSYEGITIDPIKKRYQKYDRFISLRFGKWQALPKPS